MALPYTINGVTVVRTVLERENPDFPGMALKEMAGIVWVSIIWIDIFDGECRE